MIQALPDAPDGTLATLETYTPSFFTLGSAVLCRNTAPLVAFAYTLLQRSIPCSILGRDIGTQLIGLIKKQRAGTPRELQLKIHAWSQKEVQRLIGENRGMSADRISDQAVALSFFIRGCEDVPAVIRKIETLFRDDGHPSERVTLSTIHKSKGLEYPTVFLLDFPSLIPSRYATQRWQRVQERNLQYVAVTRAMKELYYITSDCWKD